MLNVPFTLFCQKRGEKLFDSIFFQQMSHRCFNVLKRERKVSVQACKLKIISTHPRAGISFSHTCMNAKLFIFNQLFCVSFRVEIDACTLPTSRERGNQMRKNIKL